MSAKRLHVMFDDDDILLDAVKEIVKNKMYIHEVYTPFPVHGLDKAMKLKPTNIGKTNPKMIHRFLSIFVSNSK